MGNQVFAFELEFSQYLSAGFCVGVANGTDALEISLRALGVKAGSKVATVANAGFYTSAAAGAIGADCVFMDVSPENGLLIFDEAKRAIQEESPDVLVVTHLYGQAVPDTKKISEFAKSLGVDVIEDCAQAHGAKLEDRLVGTFGDLSTFSFYPTKNLGGIGDGGAIVTSRSDLRDSLLKIRQYGWADKYLVTQFGRNSRLDELQAAFLRLRLPSLEDSNYKRISAARRYSQEIVERPGILSKVSRPWDGSYVAHLFTLKTRPDLRESLMNHLTVGGVGNTIHYPVPDHQQPISVSGSIENLKATERWSSSILTLPLFPSIKDSELQHVIDTVNSWVP
jgi:dTDP-4-amino-4,6-dideoxygalactose transaminase